MSVRKGASASKTVEVRAIPLPAWIDERGSVVAANREANELFAIRSTRKVPPVHLDSLARLDPPRPEPNQRGAEYTGRLCILRGPHAGKQCVLCSRALSARPPRWLNLVWDPHQAWELESRLAREREARASAEAAMAAQEPWVLLGKLVAGVAHNLRNPLFGLTSTLDALEARLGAAAPAEFFEVMRQEAARLNRVVGQLLAYARAGAESRRELQDVKTLLATAIQHCQARAREKAVRMELTCSPGLSAITADAEQMVQAITNVLENAIAYAPQGSVVSLEAHPESRTGKRGVLLRIADRGPGFDAAVLEHAFEPFYSRRPGGTGLGLAMVARVVSEHGGQLQAANRQEGGAVVEIWLPGAGELEPDERPGADR